MGLARCRASVRLAILLLATTGVALSAPAVRAGASRGYESCQKVVNGEGPKVQRDDWNLCFFIVMAGLPGGGVRNNAPEVPNAAPAAAEDGVRSATYILTNIGRTLGKKEPDFGGLMKATTWGAMQPDRPRRVTLHTFGSDIDTVLAAYRIKDGKGKKFSYKLLKGNDDTSVPGVGRGWSLLTVDLKKGESYHVQIGGEDGAQTDRIAFTATSFGPDGGVSAFLLSTTTGATMQGRDYVCEQRPCPSPTFILHNSAKTAARVTPSTRNLSGFFTDPAPVTIAPGALAAVTFATLPFSNTGGVAEGGAFTFASTAGGKALESIEKPATVFIIDPADQADGLSMTADDRLKVGELNQPMRFDVALKNDGSGLARGCAFRTLQSNFRNVLTRFRTTTSSGKPAGDWGEAADIPAGGSQVFEVEVASMASRQGDPAFGLADEISGSCVNRSSTVIDLLGTLDVNADGSGISTVIETKLSGSGSLSVPTKGEASFDVAATNSYQGANMDVRPVYVYPSDAYDPDAQYAMSVCRLDKKKRCVAPKSFSAPWSADRRDKATFRVFVKAPKTKPPSDPGRFRIYLKFEGEDSSWPNLFGAESVAVSVK